MKLLFALLLIVLSSFSHTAFAGTKVMSLNLKYDNGTLDPEQSWDYFWHNTNDRRDRVVSVINTVSPDILGTQEMLSSQLSYLTSNLSGYGYYGIGRDSGGGGEHAGIFYKTSRYTRIDQGEFWLSNTPNVAGTTFSTTDSNPRMTTWVKLQETSSGDTIFVMCTHWSNSDGAARLSSGELMRDKIIELSGGLPVIVMGDFNEPIGQPGYYELLGINAPSEFQLRDSASQGGMLDGRTFHNWTGDPTPPSGNRIDHILHSSDAFTATSGEIIRTQFSGYEYSDHYAITATLENGSATADSDSDGFTDGVETNLGTNPNDSNSKPGDEHLNLRTWMKFEEGSGSSTADSSGYQRSGALTGSPTWSNGVVGTSSLNFDGSTQHVTVTPPIDLYTNTITMTAWIKRNGSQTDYAGVIFFRAGSTVSGIDIVSNTLRYHWKDGQYGWNSGLTLPDGEWVFVALAIEPTKATMYMSTLDGNLQSATNTTPHAIEAFASASMSIAIDPGSGTRRFKGAIDEVRIYDKTLSSTELQSIISKDYSADSDSDNIPDGWEISHFGAISTITNTDDTDADGYNTFEEMTFGMNPTVNDSNNAPQRAQIVDDSGTNKLQFKFRRPQDWATLNVQYQLQKSSSLAGDWTNDSASGTISLDGNNEWMTFLLPLTTSSPERAFYRCLVTPAP